MLKYFSIILYLVSCLFSLNVNATDSLYLPANIASYDKTADDCYFNSDGSVTSGGSACTLYLPVPLPAEEYIYLGNAYYYDNSGSQTVTVTLVRTTLSSNSYSNINTFTDTTTSSSVQNHIILFFSDISSSYSYMIKIDLNYGSEFRGILFSY